MRHGAEQCEGVDGDSGQPAQAAGLAEAHKGVDPISERRRVGQARAGRGGAPRGAPHGEHEQQHQARRPQQQRMRTMRDGLPGAARAQPCPPACADGLLQQGWRPQRRPHCGDGSSRLRLDVPKERGQGRKVRLRHAADVPNLRQRKRLRPGLRLRLVRCREGFERAVYLRGRFAAECRCGHALLLHISAGTDRLSRVSMSRPCSFVGTSFYRISRCSIWSSTSLLCKAMRTASNFCCCLFVAKNLITNLMQPAQDRTGSHKKPFL